MTFGEKMRALMAERGISLRGLARRTHYDHGYLSKISRDIDRPSQEMAERLDTALEAGGELAALRTPAAELSPDTGDPSARLRAAAAESAAWAAQVEVSNVGDLAIEQLLADTRALASDYLTEDPSGLFVDALRLRDQVFGLLQGNRHPGQSADLYVVAGYLCTLLAWISSDFGELRSADTQGRTAWLCAELAGHADLRAWVLSTRSKVAFWDGRTQDAITHARRGASYATAGTVGVLLACQEADAWSHVGARAEAREAIERAADARERSRGLDEVGGVFSCPEYRQANYTTAVRLRVDDPRTALRIAEEAITRDEPHSYGTRAQMHIALSRAYLALRHPDGVTEALRPVLDIPPEHRLAPVTRRMRELSAALSRSPVGAAAAGSELREEIDAWCADSASRFALPPPSTETT